jgi:phosphoglycolate phosphatase
LRASTAAKSTYRKQPDVAERFRLLVFDWDGTLIDSARAIVESLQFACRDVGLPVPHERDARHIIGLGLQDAFAHVLPGCSADDYSRVRQRFSHYFLQRDAQLALFPGAAAAIADLAQRGFLLGVATGKSRRGLDRALAATGLAAYFDATRCADEGFTKPHPGMLTALMNELGVEPERTLMIGDTVHDLQMACNARVASVAVTYGAHPREQLLDCGPLACCDSVTALHRWLVDNA